MDLLLVLALAGPVCQGGSDLAFNVVGAAIHVLRLSDGRDVVIDTPNATEPVFARLVRNGLFYAFNVAYAKRPGRLALTLDPLCLITIVASPSRPSAPSGNAATLPVP